MKTPRIIEASKAFAGDDPSVATPRVGFKGEITDMIEQDMTLGEAGIFHCRNYGYARPISVRHESGGHLGGRGFLLETHPELMEGKEYQNDIESECYAFVVQNILLDTYDAPEPYDDPEKFIDGVIEKSKSFYHAENYRRLLCWLLAQERETTVAEIKVSRAYAADGGQFARDRGLTIDKTDGLYRITSPKYGEFVIYPYIKAHESPTGVEQPPSIYIERPEGLIGNEPLEFFDILPREEVGAFYDAMRPGIHAMQAPIIEARSHYPDEENIDRATMIQRVDDALASLRVPKVIAALKRGKQAAPAPGADRYEAEMQ